MSNNDINWDHLTALAEELLLPEKGAGGAHSNDLEQIADALDTLIKDNDWEGIIRLRELFTGLIARDSIGIHSILQRLTDHALVAADKLGDIKELAHLYGANGHNLHRQGFHLRALEDFSQAARLYAEIGNEWESLKNYYMTALCERALGHAAEAQKILGNVLTRTAPDNPWRGNPLTVQSWLARDEGDLVKAEALLRDALTLLPKNADPDILVAGTLADLGEVLGLQGKVEEAHLCFQQSLDLIQKYQGQYDRQEARTKMKLAELEMREEKFANALQSLAQADDLISVYGTYRDMLWKIELLRAMVFIHQKKIGSAIRKFRVAKTIYEELGLPLEGFLQNIADRLKLGAGFKRVTK